MSQITYAANLSSSEFPFLSTKKTRTVVVPQADQQYNANNAVDGINARQDYIPDLYYCHNVVPTETGFQSVGYRRISNAPIPLVAGEIISYTLLIRNSGGPGVIANSARVPMAVTSLGNVYIAVGAALASPDAQGYLLYDWVFVQNIAGWANSVGVSEAYINGTQYIFSFGSCYKVNPNSLPTLTLVVLVALDMVTILGITASSGYMLAWSKDAVAWSNVDDELDFSPSLITGAGAGKIQDANGEVLKCVEINNGFIIYCTQNCVAATFSGNGYYPFNFKPLGGSGGIGLNFVFANSINDNVASDLNGIVHYAYTNRGLQTLSLVSATNSHPEIQDFLGRKVLEDFDETTLQFVYTELTDKTLYRSLTLVGGRYLVFSYGIPTEVAADPLNQIFTHALVYDQQLQRWGKLKFTHVKVIDFVQLASNVNYQDVGKTGFSLMDAAGNVSNVDFNNEEITQSGGVALFGKYQYVRTNLLQLEGVEIEGIIAGNTPLAVYDFLSLDGKNFSSTESPTAVTNVEELQVNNFHCVGLNHTIALIGRFDLSSLILTFFPHGRR